MRPKTRITIGLVALVVLLGGTYVAKYLYDRQRSHSTWHVYAGRFEGEWRLDSRWFGPRESESWDGAPPAERVVFELDGEGPAPWLVEAYPGKRPLPETRVESGFVTLDGVRRPFVVDYEQMGIFSVGFGLPEPDGSPGSLLFVGLSAAKDPSLDLLHLTLESASSDELVSNSSYVRAAQ